MYDSTLVYFAYSGVFDKLLFVVTEQSKKKGIGSNETQRGNIEDTGKKELKYLSAPLWVNGPPDVEDRGTGLGQEQREVNRGPGPSSHLPPDVVQPVSLRMVFTILKG